MPNQMKNNELQKKHSKSFSPRFLAFAVTSKKKKQQQQTKQKKDVSSIYRVCTQPNNYRIYLRNLGLSLFYITKKSGEIRAQTWSPAHITFS